ncbi:Hint domain-containing protein [Nioella aestuarii]|uniref:Hint domain-containing protein n=1 Tax=Nioella aestuarii TaxID=1662864 RepID=UPI003D7FCB8C
MADYSIWMLEESNITVSGGLSLDGITQGDGSHLLGETITLNNNSWIEVDIRDNGSDSRFDDNDNNQRLDGAQSIDGATYSDGTRIEGEYRIVVMDSDGNTYDIVAVNIVNSSPAYATIEGLAFVGPPQGWPPVGEPLTVVQTAEGPGSSGQPVIDVSDLVVPCFTPGTRIDTPDGPVAVEALEVGDMVLTMDRGEQPIRWIGSVNLTPNQLALSPSLRPILLRAKAFGPNQPDRDMLLSPQHRVLLSGAQVTLLFGEPEMLIAARDLVNDSTITSAPPQDGVTYIHFMFDQHEIVRADGIWAESFRPGPMTMPALCEDSRQELLQLFPCLALDGSGPLQPVRPLLKQWEACMLSQSAPRFTAAHP